MGEEYVLDPKAPFNMAVATLMSLRNTLDRIRDIEGRMDYPPEERQRIKIELVKRFYVDSSPLISNPDTLAKFKKILDLKPEEVICSNKYTGNRKKRIRYSFELNKVLDVSLLKLQVELQKGGYYMPPRDDMSTIGTKMS